MEIPLHIKRSMPFMKLGQDISFYHHRKHPDPFESQNVNEEPEVILKRIQMATAAIQMSIASDEFMADFRKLIGLSTNKVPPDDFIHILSLSVFYDLASLRADQTPDNIAYRLGSVTDLENVLQGRLLARNSIARYIEGGLFVLDGDYIHPSRNLIAWFTNNNPLLNCGINEGTVAKAKAQKRKKADSSNSSTSTVIDFVQNLPHLTPEQMNTLLGNEGYTGQETARHVLCLSAYRHVQRLRKLYSNDVDKIDPKELPKRENILCIGSTGCGKTYLVTLLFEKILKLPFCIVDITKFSETGYVGDEVETILTRLLNKANGDLSIAQTGVAIIDEVDKIAGTARSLSPFGGERTTKDVSGYGVQRGLLKLLEGSVVDTPVQLGDYRSNRIPFNTGHVLFIGCGAFSGLETIGKHRDKIGFVPGCNSESDTHHTSFSGNLCAYGLMPEFYGRFEQFTFFNTLPRAELRHILEVNTIGAYRKELSLENIDLQIEETAIDCLIDAAIERGTGARGLPSGLIGILTEAMYQVYSSPGANRRIRIYSTERKGRKGSGIQWEVQTKPIFKSKRSMSGRMGKTEPTPVPIFKAQSAGT